MTNANEKLLKEVSKLSPSALIELYVLDATEIGGGVLRFYPGGTGEDYQEVLYGGEVYFPLPVEARGFEFKNRGEMPRPTLKFSNIHGVMTSLVLLYDDLVGASVSRKRTFSIYLDGQPDPDLDNASSYVEDIFYIDRKVEENKVFIEFELGTKLDVEGLLLPKRQIIANICGSGYRSPECGFSGSRFVTDSTGSAYPKVNSKMYAGAYSASVSYVISQVVSVEANSNLIRYYQSISGSPLLGTAPVIGSNSPWKLIQTYRGVYREYLGYLENDSVYITAGGRTYMFICAAKCLNIAPPNVNYWVPDRCSKLVSGCKDHFDPLKKNLVLPFGGFPGCSRLPGL